MTLNELKSQLASECSTFDEKLQGDLALEIVTDGAIGFFNVRILEILQQAQSLPLNDRLSLNPKLFAAIQMLQWQNN
jgi:hypothetical protein